MAGGKTTRKRFIRLPRKRVFAIGGASLLLLTASAAGAYFMGGANLIGGGSSVYGLACTLVDSVSFRQGGNERWVRKYIAVEGSDGMGRLRTAVRVAKEAAATDHADLVLVVVLDHNGPKQRAQMRDNAVGADVIYAPHPARVAATDASFSGHYVRAEATDAGYFYGDTVSVPLPALDAMAAAMKAPYGCKMPKAEPPEGEKPAHGKAKKKASAE